MGEYRLLTDDEARAMEAQIVAPYIGGDCLVSGIAALGARYAGWAFALGRDGDTWVGTATRARAHGQPVTVEVRSAEGPMTTLTRLEHAVALGR
jgi:hypothetical protein